MAQTNRDGERRASILRLTLDGLEADLDDLRDELLDSLERYEGELRDASDSLPDWLAVEPASIRELFQLPTDGERPAGVLGPRTVALAAASVEEFIGSWLDDGPDSLDEDGARDYEAAYAAALSEIDGYETFARHAAKDARETLGEWLDGILTELEDTRERDEAALRQLVSEGTISKGRNARAEIAELWEEQRARAADVRERWARLEEHTFRGLEHTIDGLVELRSMLDRADAGVRGAYEALETDSQPTDDAADVDLPGGGTLSGMQRETERDEEATDRRQTMEIDREAPVDDVSNTFLRVSPSEVSDVSDESDESDAPEAPEAEADADEVADAEEDADEIADAEEQSEIDEVGDTLVDDIGETSPIDTSDLAELARESSVVDDEPPEADDELASDAEEHEVETVEMDREPAHFDGEDEEEEPERLEESEIQESESISGDDEAAEESDPEPKGEAEREPEPARSTVDAAFEPVFTDGFRILDQFVRVSLIETLVVLGPPVVAFVALIVATASARSGSGVDPIRETPWGLIVFAVAVVWFFLAPLIAHWQFRFDGVFPRFVRRAEVVEEADVEVDTDGISIGVERIPWEGSEIVPSRWESKPDGTFGWSIVVRRGPRELVLAAAERNFTEWERSELPIDDIDHDAWQVEGRVIRSVQLVMSD